MKKDDYKLQHANEAPVTDAAPQLAVPRSYWRTGWSTEEQWLSSARYLLELLCALRGVDDLGNQAILDVGCGSKLTKVLIEDQRPLGQYTGIDVNPEVITFLQEQVSDPRFSWHHIDVYNELYNPRGIRLGDLPALPVKRADFDIICLFSVFTHLAPDDFHAMLTLLRPCIKPDGLLVFSLYLRPEQDTSQTANKKLIQHGTVQADSMLRNMSGMLNQLGPANRQRFQAECLRVTGYDFDVLATLPLQRLEQLALKTGSEVLAQLGQLLNQLVWEDASGCRDIYPDQPLLRIVYERWRALKLIDGSGWEVVSLNPPEGDYIQDYFVCRPAV